MSLHQGCVYLINKKHICIHSPATLLGTPLKFTENGPKKLKYPVSGSCVDENALLMSEVRGEWADWLEMIKRQQ